MFFVVVYPVWPEDELRIMENIPEENLASVQPTRPSSESLKTNVPLSSMEQSAQIPDGRTTCHAPLLSELGPSLSQLDALRETDILNDLEEILTSTTNQSDTQSSTKDHQEEPVLLESAIPLPTSSEAAGKAKDSNTGSPNYLAAIQEPPSPAIVQVVLGDYKAEFPGKIGQLGETLLEDRGQEENVWSVGVQGRVEGPPHCGGKERKHGREREKGLDQVEPWEDLVHTQWVTSPLHTPTIEKLFSDVANQNTARVSQTTASQILPETEQLMPGPSPRATAVSRRNEASASRRNSSPVIPSLKPEGKAENSQDPPLQWAPKVPASAALVPRRFHRQASHDSSLYQSARLHPGFPEQRVGTKPSRSSVAPATRHRPCSLDLDRDLDCIFDLHGNLSPHHRVIRDISNQPTPQQNVLDLSTIIKKQCNLVEGRDPGYATWRTSTGNVTLLSHSHFFCVSSDCILVTQL